MAIPERDDPALSLSANENPVIDHELNLFFSSILAQPIPGLGLLRAKPVSDDAHAGRCKSKASSPPQLFCPDIERFDRRRRKSLLGIKLIMIDGQEAHTVWIGCPLDLHSLKVNSQNLGR